MKMISKSTIKAKVSNDNEKYDVTLATDSGDCHGGELGYLFE